MTMFDYETLRLIWWGLLGVLLIGFALTDGFDLGVAALLPFVGRTDAERRMVINAIGPTWEGNQVWFILAGGAIFAAWPFVYAISFSGFYLAMFLVLAALILRPVGFKYRSKRPDAAWRSRWDWALFVGGFVPALVFGVAVGNVLSGAPFRLDSDLRAFFDGSFLGLFTPFTLLCGLLSVAMLVLHGSAWLAIKVEQGAVHDRARTRRTRRRATSSTSARRGSNSMAARRRGWRSCAAPPPTTGPGCSPRRTARVLGWRSSFIILPQVIMLTGSGFR
jgi:cytochrome d ubiquinol oxidase subunit II